MLVQLILIIMLPCILKVNIKILISLRVIEFYFKKYISLYYFLFLRVRCDQKESGAATKPIINKLRF